LKIISRYVLREFFKIFALTVCGLLTIIMVFDFFENLDLITLFHAPPKLFFYFLVFRVPFVVYQLIPLSALISTLICLNLFARNREVVAMRANGISLYHLAGPILVLCFGLSLFCLILNESIVPAANVRSRWIERIEIKKKKPLYMFPTEHIWLRNHNNIYSINWYDEKNTTLHQVSINEFDDHFELVRRWEARTGIWDGRSWVFHDVNVKQLDQQGRFQLTKKKRERIPFPLKPDDFTRPEKKIEEMSYFELRDYIQQAQEEGHDATFYLPGLQAKLAFPFVSFIMSLIAIPLALRTGTGKGIATSIGLGLLLGFGYWLIFGFSLSFGHAGFFPPVIAAWLTNTLFASFGIFLLLTVRY